MLLNNHELGLITAALRYNAMAFERLAADAQKRLSLRENMEYSAYYRACAGLADKIDREGGGKRPSHTGA